MTRMQFAGAAIQTTLTDTVAAAGAVSLKIDDATGWPDASVGPFEIIVGAGLPNEEKMLVHARAGTTLTVAAEGRGYDGTTPQGHEAGEVVYPIVSALWFDKVDQHVENPNVHLSAGAVQTSHIADSAVTTAKIASSAVTTAKIDDGAITPAKLAASVIPIPIGAVIEYPVGPLADWMVELNGQAISRSAYPELHALYQAAGYPYGDGDGSTTFNVEDRRGRVPVMLHSGDGDFDTVGKKGGAKDVALTEAQVAAHKHAVDHDHPQFNSGNQSANHTHSGTTAPETQQHQHAAPEQFAIWYPTSSLWVVESGSPGAVQPVTFTSLTLSQNANHTHTFTTGGVSANHHHTVNVPPYEGESGSAGGGEPHPNLQPYSVTRWVVRAR